MVEKGKNAELVYTLEMPATSSLYMYLPSKYERTVNVWLNRKTFLGTYFEGDNNSIMKIGDFKRGEKVIIGLTLTRDDLYFKEAQFVYINDRNVKKDLQKLLDSNTETYAERPTPTSMKVSVNAKETSYLFTSIPEEKGWEVFVDGSKTDYEICLGALLSVPISPGKHIVEFRFTTAGYPLAVIVSIAGLALFIAMIFIQRKFFRPDDDSGLDVGFGSGGSGGSEDKDKPAESANDTESGGENDEEDEESDLLDIFRPKGSGSEWLI